jgi:hypothetical protein
MLCAKRGGVEGSVRSALRPLEPADVAPRRSGPGLYNGLWLSGNAGGQGPGGPRRDACWPACRRSMGLEPLAQRPGRAGRASGVTGLDGAWPGGAVPAGPPTSHAPKRPRW